MGQVDIDHNGISLFEKNINETNEDLVLGIDIDIQKKVYEILYKEAKFLEPDYSLKCYC